MADNRKKEFWVVCETSGASVIRASGELLGLASRLSGKTGWKTVAVLIGAQSEQHASLLTALGAETIYLLEHPLLDHINELMVSRILSELVEEYRPEVVVFSATVHGRSIAPQVAAALRTGLTADCTGLDLDSEGLLVQTRPAFGENLIAEILCRTARPQMATVRPGVFPYPKLDQKKTAKIIDEKRSYKEDEDLLSQGKRSEPAPYFFSSFTHPFQSADLDPFDDKKTKHHKRGKDFQPDL